MVVFAPGFVSQAIADHGNRAREAQLAAMRKNPNDSAAVNRELRDWRAANPSPKATLAQVADHIEHVVKMASIDNVGIGSDFDGVDDLPIGLEDVSTYPALLAELSRRGWSEANLRKLAGENVLRAFKRAEDVSARLRKERPASTKTIQELDGRRM
jgi:membrane dipeptidase